MKLHNHGLRRIRKKSHYLLSRLEKAIICLNNAVSLNCEHAVIQIQIPILVFITYSTQFNLNKFLHIAPNRNKNHLKPSRNIWKTYTVIQSHINYPH